jgi:AraC-like DNA-binding protein
VIQQGPYIKACVLFGFAREVRTLGGDPDMLFHKVGLSPDILENADSVISCSSVSKLFEITSRELGHPGFVFDWAQSMAPHFPNLGPIVMLARFSSDTRNWISTALKYWALYTNAYTFELLETCSATPILRYHASPFAVISHQLVLSAIANIVGLGRSVLDLPDKNPELIRFNFRKPANISALELFFRCPIEFDADHTEILFDGSYLDTPTNGNLTLFRHLLDIYVRKRLRHMAVHDQSVKNTVALAISTLLGTRRSSFETVAEAMGMHGKKLQRLLDREGFTFTDIMEEVRQATAIHLLQETNMSIDRIAALLDYSSNPAFTLAFKRWMGISPLQFRKKSQNLLMAQELIT